VGEWESGSVVEDFQLSRVKGTTKPSDTTARLAPFLDAKTKLAELEYRPLPCFLLLQGLDR
jgi:hypothetical protein